MIMLISHLTKPCLKKFLFFALYLSLSASSARSTSLEANVNVAVDSERVLPVVRSIEWFNKLPASARERLVMRPFATELIVILVEDKASETKFLTPDEVKSLGWPAEDEKVNGLINFAKIIRPRFQIRGSEGLFMITAGGNYEASLILAPMLWRGLNSKIKGQPVVGIPNKDLFFVTGSEDQEGLAQLRSIVLKFFKEGANPISEKLFILRNDGTYVFK